MKSEPLLHTYAQFYEDLILAALLDDKEKGFYVDVGANHEEFHSVTKYFYKHKGWRGINIEPIPRLYKELATKRPRDINLNCAVSSRTGSLSFREYPQHDGWSTFSEESKKENEKLDIPYKDYSVKMQRLSDIFKTHKVTSIDFLKVDVEGYEAEVLKSNDWTLYRPAVICIEANHRTDNWPDLLESKRYKRYIFDGLNEYYIADEHGGLIDGFAERATMLASGTISNYFKQLWDKDLSVIQKLEQTVADRETDIVGLKDMAEAAEARLHSLRFLFKTGMKEIARRLGKK